MSKIVSLTYFCADCRKKHVCKSVVRNIITYDNDFSCRFCGLKAYEHAFVDVAAIFSKIRDNKIDSLIE